MKQKYDYQFVRFGAESSESAASICGRPDATYQDVVRKYGEDGWRLVQIYTPVTTGGGLLGGPSVPMQYELIFERDAEEHAEPGAPADGGGTTAFRGK